MAGSGSTGAAASSPALLPSCPLALDQAEGLPGLASASPTSGPTSHCPTPPHVPPGNLYTAPNGPPQPLGPPKTASPTDAPLNRAHTSPNSPGPGPVGIGASVWGFMWGPHPPGAPQPVHLLFCPSVCLQGISRSASSVLTVPQGPFLGAARAAAHRGPSESRKVSWEVPGGRGPSCPSRPSDPMRRGCRAAEG